MSNSTTSFINSLKSSKGGKSSWTYEEDRAMLNCILEGIGGAAREDAIGPQRSPAGFHAKKAQLLKMIEISGATNAEEAYAALVAKHGIKEEVVA